ncbi:ycf4, partial [Symbiodinium necroappetens]
MSSGWWAPWILARSSRVGRNKQRRRVAEYIYLRAGFCSLWFWLLLARTGNPPRAACIGYFAVIFTRTMAKGKFLLKWLVVAVFGRSLWTAFVGPSPQVQTPSREVALAAEGESGGTFGGGMSKDERQLLMDWMAPPDQLMEETEDGMILREKYPGGRSATSVFWAIVQPAVSLGFLVVGVSSFFGEPIVDWNPITSEYLGFLRPSEGINFLPQGAFMSFYGIFGFFIFGPIQWYINIFNVGQGVCEFNKKDGYMYMVRNGDMIREVPLSDFQAVKFEWTNMAITGSRDLYLVTQ